MAPEPEMEFCLLGPLLVRRGLVELPVSPGKQRSLLAALLLNANTVVPARGTTLNPPRPSPVPGRH